MPTATARRSLDLGREGFTVLSAELRALLEDDLVRLEEDLEAAGAPWTPGRRVSGTRPVRVPH